MKVSEIVQSDDQNAIVAELQTKRFIAEPDVASAEKALDPLQHDVFDERIRPDKKVRVDEEDVDDETITVVTGDKEKVSFRKEPVARIGLDLPGLIVKRAVAMIFGNDVELNADPENEQEEAVLKAVEKIRHDVKEKSLNRKIAKAMFSCTEAAELWYAVPIDRKNPKKKVSKYGINTSFKLRCMVLSPMKGDRLFPYFDQTGDMIAFSREYSRTDDKKVTHTYFETWTDEEHFLWERTGSGFQIVEGFPAVNPIGKIPVIFGNEEETEFAKVMILVNRLEKLLSNFADTNDYHASPKIFVQGHVEGFSKKGEAGAILEGEEGSSAQYLSWANAPESVRLEIETLLKMIYTISQTPDISFDSVKGLGAISGVALKLLFMDAHLKVMDHMEVFDDYLQRRYNVIKAFIGKMDTRYESPSESLDIEPIVTPYMITDDNSEMTLLMNASGGKPIMSQKTAIRKAGVVEDVDAEMDQINAETDRANQFFLNEPTNVME